jgi:hypothetical protein
MNGPGILEELAEAIHSQSRQLEALTAAVSQLREKVQPTREIYTLRDLAERPEAPGLKTLRNCPDRQPNAGQPDGYRGAQKCWYAETVLAWRRQLSPRPGTSRRIDLHRAAS